MSNSDVPDFGKIGKGASAPRIGLTFQLRYAAGEGGITLIAIFIAYHLMFFMTDVIRIPVGTAAILYTALQWLEAVSMVFAGFLIDRIRFGGGSYHPWLTCGSLVCMVFLVLTFIDYRTGIAGRIILFATFYVLMYTGYNLAWVAYRALLGTLSHGTRDAAVLSSRASLMSSVASFAFSYAGVGLLYAFPDIRHGYLASAFVYGLLFILGMLVVTALVKPYDKPRSSTVAVKRGKASVADMIRTINKPMVTLFSAVSFRESVNSMLGVLLVYYFTYCVGDRLWLGYYIGVTAASTFLGILCVPFALKRIGKKRIFLYSAWLCAACLLMLNLNGGSLAWFMTWMAIRAFFSAFAGVLLPAFVTDIATYNEARHGNQAKAFAYSIGGLAIRTSSILGAAIASFGLYALGYQAGQTPSGSLSTGLTLLMTIGGSLVYLVSSGILAFYKLDDTLMQRIYDAGRQTDQASVD